MSPNVSNILPIALGCVVAIATLLEARLLRQNAALKRKLRRALLDCRAFYEIEARLCGYAETSTGHSALSIKRMIRDEIRRDGMESPSAEATPQRISQELQRL